MNEWKIHHHHHHVIWTFQMEKLKMAHKHTTRNSMSTSFFFFFFISFSFFIFDLNTHTQKNVSPISFQRTNKQMKSNYNEYIYDFVSSQTQTQHNSCHQKRSVTFPI